MYRKGWRYYRDSILFWTPFFLLIGFAGYALSHPAYWIVVLLVWFLPLGYTFAGLVVASVFYSLPFVVQPLQNAFEAIGERPLEVARQAKVHREVLGRRCRALRLAGPRQEPDDLAAALQALAGPSAGPNGGQIFVDGFTGGRLPPRAGITPSTFTGGDPDVGADRRRALVLNPFLHAERRAREHVGDARPCLAVAIQVRRFEAAGESRPHAAPGQR